MNNIGLFALMILMSMGIVIFEYLFVNYTKKTLTVKTKGSNTIGYDNVMNILDEAIKREFTFKYKLFYEIRDIRILYNFEDDLKELVQNVIFSFGEEYMNELKFYFTQDYILTYVTKKMELILMDFTKERKIKTK